MDTKSRNNSTDFNEVLWLCIVAILETESGSTITQEYEKNKCKVDYHGSCKDVWKGCKSAAANSACPKTCGNSACSASCKLEKFKLTFCNCLENGWNFQSKALATLKKKNRSSIQYAKTIQNTTAPIWWIVEILCGWHRAWPHFVLIPASIALHVSKPVYMWSSSWRDKKDIQLCYAMQKHDIL